MADKAKTDLLDACRAALRIPAFCNDFDEEIADMIDAARAELVAGGVLPAKAADDDDGRIRLAIKVYVKYAFPFSSLYLGSVFVSSRFPRPTDS